MRTMILGLFGAVVTAIGGCAANKPVDDFDLRLEAATHAFGGSYQYLLVESGGKVDDGAFITMARTTGSSRLARDLGKRLAAAASEPVRMLVTGPSGDKNVQVVADALAPFGENELVGLELLYLGEPADEAAIRASVTRVGARLRFAPYAR